MLCRCDRILCGRSALWTEEFPVVHVNFMIRIKVDCACIHTQATTPPETLLSLPWPASLFPLTGQARPTHLQIFLKPPHHQITISTLSPVNSASTNHIPPSPYFLSSQLSSILILNQQQPTPIYLNSSSRLHRSHLKSSFAQPLSYLNFSATIASSITAVHQFDLSSNAVTPSQLPDHRLGNSQLFNPQQTITAVTLNLSGNPAQPRGSIPPV
ncbi:hypothetical protein M0R45_001588 [Rubus argutus]|uniref:Uncharacterized protein n=1 Tax=Rubus argutus TaxID=59490 RepID=A0AAW1VG39_RUBAR